MNNRIVNLDNWAFGLIPEAARKGRIVALFGTVVESGRFLSGSGRIVSFDPKTRIAKSESGTGYALGAPDQITFNEFIEAINKYSK